MLKYTDPNELEQIAPLDSLIYGRFREEQLFEAAKRGCTLSLRYLRETVPDDMKRNLDYDYAFNLACRAGHKAFVDALLDVEPPLAIDLYQRGQRILLYPVGDGHKPDLLVGLLARTGHWELDLTRINLGERLLQKALGSDEALPIARQLLRLEGSRFHAADASHIPFRVACESGNVQLVRRLLAMEGGARVDVHADAALVGACWYGSLGVVRLLLSLEGDRRVDVRAYEDEAFVAAYGSGNVELVRELLLLECDRAPDLAALGCRAMVAASHSGNVDTLQCLVIASGGARAVAAGHSDIAAGLTVAVQRGHAAAVRFLLALASKAGVEGGADWLTGLVEEACKMHKADVLHVVLQEAVRSQQLLQAPHVGECLRRAAACSEPACLRFMLQYAQQYGMLQELAGALDDAAETACAEGYGASLAELFVVGVSPCAWLRHTEPHWQYLAGVHQQGFQALLHSIDARVYDDAFAGVDMRSGEASVANARRGVFLGLLPEVDQHTRWQLARYCQLPDGLCPVLMRRVDLLFVAVCFLRDCASLPQCAAHALRARLLRATAGHDRAAPSELAKREGGLAAWLGWCVRDATWQGTAPEQGCSEDDDSTKLTERVQPAWANWRHARRHLLLHRLR